MADTELQKLGLIVHDSAALRGANELEAPVRIEHGAYLENSSVGAYTLISHRASLVRATVGRYCTIAHEAAIGMAEHPTDWLTTSAVAYSNVFGLRSHKPGGAFEKTQPVTLGNDVWVGARAFIRGGVTIGDGAIIGYGAVVTKDVPAFAIVGGVPALVLRYRFDGVTVARLLASKWWDYDLVAAKNSGLHISWDNPAAALDEMAAAIGRGQLPKIENRTRRLVA